MTPGELQLAGWIVYAVVLWFVLFAIDQRGMVRLASSVLDERPVSRFPASDDEGNWDTKTDAKIDEFHDDALGTH